MIEPSRDPIYLEARNYLTRLEKMKELFKYQKVELILGEIDKYSGTTVKDLVDFMKTHSLQFGVPDDIGDEQKLYNRLFASLEAAARPRQDPHGRADKELNAVGPGSGARRPPSSAISTADSAAGVAKTCSSRPRRVAAAGWAR